MDSAYKFMIRTMKFSVFVFLFEVFIILIVAKSPTEYILGLLIGYLLNLVFFRIMYLNAKSKLEMVKKKAITFTRINYFARMLIAGLVFYIAIKSPYISFLTCVIGMFNIRFAIYLSVIYDALRSKNNLS